VAEPERRRSSKRLAASDGGFTLPELLVSISLAGLVAGVTALAFMIVVRSLPLAAARADDARTMSGLTIYLPEDVGSTPPGSFVVDDPDHLTGCAGDSPGRGLLHLTWSDSFQTWNVDYRLDADSEGTRIFRYSCAPGGVPVIDTLTSYLPSVDLANWQAGDEPVVIDPILDDDGLVSGVVVTVSTVSGRTAQMVVRSNNPAAELSSGVTTTSIAVGTTTTMAPTTTVGGTTLTTTTTVPPCTAVSLVAVPVDPTNDTGKSSKSVGPLRDHVDVMVTTSGVCNDLVLEFDPDLSDGTYDPQWLSFGATGGTVTIEAHPAGESWSDGSHTLTLRNGIGTDALTAVELVVS
jgi:prepilin-type N-terminal cleavage/methylation domain-containing protein